MITSIQYEDIDDTEGSILAALQASCHFRETWLPPIIVPRVGEIVRMQLSESSGHSRETIRKYSHVKLEVVEVSHSIDVMYESERIGVHRVHCMVRIKT